VENKEIARVLAETADLMEIAGEDSFPIRAYRRASTAIEGYPERMEDILRDPNRHITDIPDIGKKIATVVAEILERRTCERRELLLQKFPVGTLDFLKIQGLGPKGIALIFEHFRVATIDELREAVPGSEAARAAAHGREARRESPAVNRAIPAADRPPSAESCGRHRGRAGGDASNHTGCRAGDSGRQPAPRPRDGGRSSTCW
jgi:hypothetical protein